MRRAWVLALLVLLLPPLPLPSVAAAATTAAWWPPGKTDVGEGFHIRVPVTVRNDLGYDVTAGAVAAQVDVTAKLIEAGWTKSPSGDRDLLKGFHLDPDSVRVVAMSSDGQQLRASDPRFTDPADARRYEVPSVHFEGSLETGAQPFDPFVNPFITVLWRVPFLRSGEQARYMVYLDTDLTNPKKAPASYTDSQAGGDVLGLFWSGAATTLYGYAAGANSVQVIGLHPDTHVEAFAGPPGATMAPMPVPGGGNRITLGKDQSATLPVSSGARTAFMLVADRPILAQVVSAGFVPSLDGGMTGREFVFALRHPAAWEQDTVYFSAIKGDTDTTVQVERIGGGFSATVNLGKGSPFAVPYTIGGRSALASDCSMEDPPSPLLPAEPGLYRARVTRGDRIVVQLQATDALSQVPALNGAPSGTAFRAATDWTDSRLSGTGCSLSTRTVNWFATATGADGKLNATSDELGHQVEPRGDPRGTAYPTGRTVRGGPQLGGPFRAAFPDRPLLFQATEPVRLFVGPYPAQIGTQGLATYPNDVPAFGTAGVPAIHGPLGGDGAGRAFTGAGASLVLAPFDGTVVDVDAAYSSGDGQQRVSMSAGSSFVLQDRSSSDLLRAYTLRSNLPVFVYPLGASAAFLAGTPAFLDVEVGAAEFRGYLVRLSSPTGLDPVAGSGVPNVPVRYPLEVTNLGRGVGGASLDDDLQIGVDRSSLPFGWTARADLVGVHLASGQKQAFTLTVTAPPDAIPGETAIVTVLANSTRNRLVQDSLQVVTFVKQSFGVGLWFEAEGGPQVREKDVVDGKVDFPMVVRNKGSVADVIRLLAEPSEHGWTAILLRNGAEVDEVALEAQTNAQVILRVSAPANGSKLAIIPVTATSVSAPANRERATAIAEVVDPSLLRLDTGPALRFVDPGANATFNLTLRNQGGGGDLRVTVQGGAPGWGTPRATLRGSNDPPPSSLGDNETLRLQVVIQAPRNATAGAMATLRFSARPGTGAAVEAVLFAKVRAVHSLEATLPSLPVGIEALGQNVSIEMRLRNRGNLDELVNLTAAELPPGWSLGLPEDVLVPRNGTQALTFTLAAPSGTRPGAYNATLRLTARDGNQTLVAMPILVGAVAGQRVGAAPSRAVQPGERALVEVPLSNEGNTLLRVRVEPQAGDAWILHAGPEFSLRPGERTVVAVEWEVPRDAANGASTHAARLRIVPDGSAESSIQAVSGTFEVARAELAAAGVRSLSSPGGTLVMASVENRGERPAKNFTVDLLVNGQLVDRIPVGELPANETVEVAFLQVEGGPAQVVIDGDRSVVEADESDNAAPVPAVSGRSTPAGPMLILALALAIALRRRGGPA